MVEELGNNTVDVEVETREARGGNSLGVDIRPCRLGNECRFYRGYKAGSHPLNKKGYLRIECSYCSVPRLSEQSPEGLEPTLVRLVSMEPNADPYQSSMHQILSLRLC